MTPTRRSFLRLAGIGGSSVLLAGCSDSARGRAPDGGRSVPDAGIGADAAVFPDAAPYDPMRPFWLQGNYAPVQDELEALDLEVTGTLPPSLDGIYARNGSNPRSGESGHWFLGDGMLHGVRIQGGRAAWYRNRWVRTALYDNPMPQAGPPTLERNASNVSLVHHAGRLLSLGEVGLPYEIGATDLATRGGYTFDARLMTAMTAHPKIDPVTGELLFFGYGFLPPYLTYHVADRTGALVHSQVLDVPKSVMMHDFAITTRYAVFMDLPIVFDINMAIRGVSFPYRWDPSNGARLGFLRRDGSAPITWLPIATCYVFHTLNAYEDPAGRVVLEAVRYPELWASGPEDFGAPGQLWRFTADLAAGTVSEAAIDDRPVEFPQLDARKRGLPQRFGYALSLRAQGAYGIAGTSGIVKYDRTAGQVSAFAFAAAEQPDEALFVPDSTVAGEDEGWLLTYVYDARRDRTDLVVLDASRLDAGPVARIHLPRRVPFGFHGVWVPTAG